MAQGWTLVMVNSHATEKKRVLLIVEDFDNIRNLFGRYLSVHDYEVISAGTIADAIALGKEAAPDIVLMDFDMRSTDPYKNISALHNALPSSKLVTVDGSNRHILEDKAKIAGATTVVPRTMAPDKLESTLNA
ncbi:MAG: response regulator transcription factor [Bacteroidetes bacterium]|nr:response regulator transcription factor [Bacteroidota bacterium]